MPPATVRDIDALPAMLTKQQVSDLLGISTMKVDSLLREPTFPKFVHGRVTRVPRQQLMQWLASYVEKATANK
jgi:excisionase family DNA binding protein